MGYLFARIIGCLRYQKLYLSLNVLGLLEVVELEPYGKTTVNFVSLALLENQTPVSITAANVKH